MLATVLLPIQYVAARKSFEGVLDPLGGNLSLLS